MIDQNTCFEEVNKATVSYKILEVNWHASVYLRHTVCILLQLPCIKCTLFNSKMIFLYFIKLDLFELNSMRYHI